VVHIQLAFLSALHLQIRPVLSTMLLKWSTLIALIVAASAAPTAAPAPELRGLLKADGFTSQQWRDGFAKAQALVASLSFDQKVRRICSNGSSRRG
jgi:hypothetical protein